MAGARALRLVPVAGAAWIGAALSAAPALAAPVSFAAWSIVGALLVGAAALGRGRRCRLAPLVGAIIALCALAAAASHVALAEHDRSLAGVGDLGGGRAVTALVEVTGKVERTPTGLNFDAVMLEVRAGSIGLRARTPAVVRVTLDDVSGGRLDVGAVAEARGTLRAADVGRRETVVVTAARGVVVIREPGGAAAVTSDLRRGLVQASAGLPGDGAGLLPGLAVGDTSAVPSDLDAAMKASSLSHLTAVSGANCALVVGIAYAVAAGLGLGRRSRVAAGVVVLGGFVMLVTPEPSVVRAAVMAAIAMVSLLLGRTPAGVATLSLAVAGSLVVDPWLATSLGFALSVAATASLLVLARPLARGLERVLPRGIALLLAVPIAAQLACGPLLILIEPVVPAYGVVANVLAGPAAPAVTVIGLAACLAAPFPLLQAGLVAIAWMPAAWIAATARLFAALPGSGLAWIDGVIGAALLATIGAAVAVLMIGPRGTRPQRVVGRISAVVVAVAVGLVGGQSALSSIAAPLTVPQAWAVLACDVGQGDALLMRSAGAVALVDTGPDDAALARCLARAGVSRIDLLVLTHFDADHAGAAPSLTGRVGTVLHGPTDDDGVRTLELLASAGAAPVEAHTGMTGHLGEATWTVLWPDAGLRAFPPGNDASVVLDVRGATVPSILLLGDLSASPQRMVLSSGLLEPPYAVVKVAHHGSADQAMELYHEAAAGIAVLSVGAGNTYGHPRDEALTLLGETSTKIARTDREGMIGVWLEGGALRLWRERGGAVGGPG
ncbi:competence protein ComEC [Microbacterium terrae]|uniref:ComEC family competence protein n=1 Tax=Microbacterium terrae TaxID=69369 RepID=A0A0M2HGQ3_9MICO|nr:ComEC/Rec2 family competence protein [Microbacterium terrae]KJL45841.1 ComEC family competence protein [Microbacterium terrae]MBP1077263.1 competence protein ComEC [Microbacterium terrae]GLJ98874.1 competence protein ComEC [Microbacterium terrae]